VLNLENENQQNGNATIYALPKPRLGEGPLR
jgi:hypothetical protein